MGGYFDLAPVDLGEEARRAIVDVLEQMGFEVEAAHHEVAHGQHEIDFRYADALTTADNIATFRFVVKHVAQQFGLRRVVHAEADLRAERQRHAHAPVALPGRHERVLRPEGASGSCRRIALHYIGGLLRARARDAARSRIRS